MGDGVAPGAELFEPPLPRGSTRIQPPHGGPEGEAEPVEVGTDIPGRRIPAIEATCEEELVAHEVFFGTPPQGAQEGIDALGVEIAAERLELGAEEHGIRVVQLLGGRATTSMRATERRMGGLDGVELSGSGPEPTSE